MSIADKLTQIAENEPKVYEAGKLALLKASTYMQGTASGKTVRVDDVSPVEHEISVTVSSDTADVSAVTVTRYGKNLLPFPNVDRQETTNGITFTLRDDGTVIANGTATANAIFTFYSRQAVDLPAGSYAVSGCPAGGDGSTTYRIQFACYNHNGDMFVNKAVGQKGVAFTAAERIKKIYLTLVIFNGQVVENLVFKPQLELGSNMTKYEPYKEPSTHTPAADGVLTVPSVYPTTTLTCDTPDVMVDCSYLRDIDTYIDNVITDVALTGGE